MTINLSALQQQRRDTAANWTSQNPTLLAGEIGYETDTGYIKVGDGSTAWTSLAYIHGTKVSAYPLATVDIGDGAVTSAKLDTNIDIAGTLDVTGAATFDDNLTVQGDLTVNGATTTIDTTTLTVEDKNIELGTVATPTDVTADGGGITLKGATDHTIVWTNSTDSWDFSEHVNIATGKEFQIAGTKVLDATSLGSAVVTSSLTSVGTIATGTWSASTIAVDKGGTGQTSYTDGQLLIGNTTGNTLDKATLTAGSGVSITNGSGSIEISATGSGGTVTSIDVSGGTGLTSSGGPVTSSGTITVDLDNTAVTAGSYTNADITVDAQGRITAAANGSTGGTGTVTSVDITGGTGLTATGGPITSSGSITVDLDNTAVTAGSYTAADITVDAQGRITAAASGTIGTAEIADDAVTAAKLADTAVTAGSYTAADITVDAQGRITAAANGSGGGAWNLVATVNASAASSITFQGDLDSTYKQYVLIISELVSDGSLSSAPHLTFMVGATELTGSLYDTIAIRKNLSSSTVTGIQIGNQAYGRLTQGGLDSDAPDHFYNAVVWLNGGRNSKSHQARYESALNQSDTTGEFYTGFVQYFDTVTRAVDGVRITPSSNTFTGTFKLYGIS